MLASDKPEYLDIFLILHALQGIIYLLLLLLSLGGAVETRYSSW
jgi:hypothetical protein